MHGLHAIMVNAIMVNASMVSAIMVDNIIAALLRALNQHTPSPTC